MKKYIFLGISYVDFTVKDGPDKGKLIRGYKIWLLEPASNGNQVGMIPFSSFVSPEIFSSQFGKMIDYKDKALMECEVVFGRRNRIESIVFSSVK